MSGDLTIGPATEDDVEAIVALNNMYAPDGLTLARTRAWVAANKQVADRLYLSAKTVEHHIARIRQRLGCTDRRDLLARLRELLPDAAPAGAALGEADGAVA